jgi:hypothetical protein
MINGAANFSAASPRYIAGRRKTVAKKSKMSKTMHEFKGGKLHSGSKSGPKVKSRKQAIAIGLNQARKAGEMGGRKKREPKMLSDREFGMR